MILSGHQPNYLPYPGLISKIAHSDKFMYVSNVQFDKKSWQNRNRIRTKEGWTWLTVPTLTKGKREQLISEVEINNKIDWKKKHFNSIKLNYGKTDYYTVYIDFFEDLYAKEWNSLNELNIYIMNYLLGHLEIKTHILYDTNFKFEGQKTERLVEMCQQTGCNLYLSNKGSENYVEISSFKDKGLAHQYIDYKGTRYKQAYSGFEEGLSIIDLLFNCGKEVTREMLMNEKNYIFSEVNKKIGE